MIFKNLSAALALILSTSVVWAQGSVVNLPVNHFKVDSTNQNQVMDLMQEILRASPNLKGQNLQIEKISISAKSDVGGAAFFLRENGHFMAGKSIATDPDTLNSNDSMADVELMNIRESDSDNEIMQTAELIVNGHARITGIRVMLGEAETVTWQVPVAPPGISAPMSPVMTQVPLKPVSIVPAALKPLVLQPLVVQQPQQQQLAPLPSVAVPVATVVQAAPAEYQAAPQPTCVGGICMGDHVANARLSVLRGTVVGVYPAQGQIAVKYYFRTKIEYLRPDQVDKQ